MNQLPLSGRQPVHKKPKYDNPSLSSSEVAEENHKEDESDSDDDDYSTGEMKRKYHQKPEESIFSFVKPKKTPKYNPSIVTPDEMDALWTTSFGHTPNNNTPTTYGNNTPATPHAAAAAAAAGVNNKGRNTPYEVNKQEVDDGYMDVTLPDFFWQKQPNSMFNSLYIVFVSHCIIVMDRNTTTHTGLKNVTKEEFTKYNDIKRRHFLLNGVFLERMTAVTDLCMAAMERDIGELKWFQTLKETMEDKTMITINKMEIRDQKPRTCHFTGKKAHHQNPGYVISARTPNMQHSYNATVDVSIFFAHYQVITHIDEIIENYIAAIKQNFYKYNRNANQLQCMFSLLEHHNENFFSHIDTIWAFIYRSLWYMANQKYMGIE